MTPRKLAANLLAHGRLTALVASTAFLLVHGLLTDPDPIRVAGGTALSAMTGLAVGLFALAQGSR